MESSLAQVILDMQDEIKKLESENKVLRGQLSQAPLGTDQAGSLLPESPQENPLHANLRRNSSAPALEGKYKVENIMTVRRYSVSSNSINAPSKRQSSDNDGDIVNSNWARVHEGIRGRTFSPSREDGSDANEKLTSRRTLQQYVNKNRAKVKTVTFLLPVEDIYTSQPTV
ncbi:hypothetical protein P4O66_014003 [Electrophorus voltai]|uniref:Uncharacterized protein n=1 Tax=Electrophorus voltai TaxID=2609070 RepID=A0AAD8YZZ8_9TELE|nr:hypothetical protein P4O66_014003 [Electrophorus voltai]